MLKDNHWGPGPFVPSPSPSHHIRLQLPRLLRLRLFLQTSWVLGNALPAAGNRDATLCQWLQEDASDTALWPNKASTQGERHGTPGTWRRRQDVPESPGNHQKPGQRPGTGSPSQLPEGTSPADTSILDSSPPELWDNTSVISATLFVALCYSSPSKVTEAL